MKYAKNTEDFNTFFSNAGKNLKILGCEKVNPFAEKL